ncbi:MAG: alpha/beta fold hydrolase, partial [Thermoleophilaceae bacterium]
MPLLQRPEGVLIHWEARGEGPLLVFVTPMFSTHDVYDALLDDLASDHRLVVYDARGVGRSSRVGPYDIDTDAADLAAVIEAAGPPAVVAASAESLHRAARVAAERPDLIPAVVNVGGVPAG